VALGSLVTKYYIVTFMESNRVSVTSQEIQLFYSNMKFKCKIF